MLKWFLSYVGKNGYFVTMITEGFIILLVTQFQVSIKKIKALYFDSWNQSFIIDTFSGINFVDFGQDYCHMGTTLYHFWYGVSK